ncbi:peptidylprolyl isomerase [Lihuaxuella thermophila]|uniref:Foldase protein PrsA n=1 Tax=Lihuaxuella thermophila TaxID=1173111 RepID=A0A1H8I5X1_9BACL|nr:peptidylprolyl isomerase [Lihuaxuella thermophila]SEN64023.1 foldase protein PrsA [Lihuaxuella thermophila]
MQVWNKRLVIGALTIFLASSMVLTGCGTAEKQEQKQAQQTTQPTQFKPLSTTSKKVVAEFKGGKITEGELNRYINVFSFFQPQFAMMFTDPSLKGKQNEIKAQLAKDFAGQLYIASVVPDGEYEKKADETLKQLESQLKSGQAADGQKGPQSIEEAIKGKGFTKDELREFIIRDHKIQAYYEERLKKLQYDNVKVNHILIGVGNDKPKRTDAEAKKRAEEVKKKLDAGGDFAKLAKEYSDDPGSKDQGGLVEGPPEMFVPEFANAAKTLPIGKISDPVKTDYGYHILKVVERNKKSYDQAPDQLKMDKQQEIFEEMVQKELQFKSFLPAPKPAEK